MKKMVLVVLSVLTLSTLTACGVPQDDYDSLQDNYDSLQNDYDSLQSKFDTSESQKEELQSKIDSLQSEYDAYKEKMSAYENLEAAEVEARQIEADRIAAEQKAAAEAAALEAAAAAAEEEAKGYETGITYSEIARTPDDYMGKKVMFTGKVVQLIEGAGTNQIRFAINKDYDQVVLCEYDSSITESRILENDVITIYGISAGTISYQSTLGGQITIPSILVERIDQ